MADGRPSPWWFPGFAIPLLVVAFVVMGIQGYHNAEREQKMVFGVFPVLARMVHLKPEEALALLPGDSKALVTVEATPGGSLVRIANLQKRACDTLVSTLLTEPDKKTLRVLQNGVAIDPLGIRDIRCMRDKDERPPVFSFLPAA
jgi:hypothetical protein